MAKRHDIHPPLEDKRTLMKQKMLRGGVNLLVLLGTSVLFYVVYSFFFDTPAESRLRKSTEGLRKEYRVLAERMDEVEGVLDNVVERDKNVFRIMFESEPYILDEYEAMRWTRMENLFSLNNKELAENFYAKTDEFDNQLDQLGATYDKIYEAAQKLGEKTNYIPAIQPVINKELTLMTASFGMRIHPFYKNLSQHNGVDFTVPDGSRVFATADGTVTEAGVRSSSSGISVIINHGNGYETRYNHLGETMVSRGQRIRRGDIIALTGNSGLSLAPHLHYEVLYKGKALDPVDYFFIELNPREYHKLIRIAGSGMQSFD